MNEMNQPWKMRSRGSGSAKRRKRATRENMPPYVMPHKYLPLVRGVPIRDHREPYAATTQLNPMAVPIEIQNSLAFHLEMVGLVHVSDLIKMADENGNINVSQLPPVYIKHVKPEFGPDIQLNPGTWMPKNQAEKVDAKRLSAEVIEPAKVDNIKDADFKQLEALESQIREEKIKRLREANVDPHVTDERGPGAPDDVT
ncbi:hypothetical protein SEA_FORZA_103 [Gordonia phage Forza]|uniref:Minor tail protein n=1 Tax=Gordonia phage Forza TaxID=2571247 RepID=A0A650EY66_9CAUD|nr:minor tail protein [Gordonia phage Forza]QEM41570.1 hypothetical protein SEA_BOOPY_103 [Gordonia phage Boopy]QGT55096.1 hypothetical protein SEA_FORZA_103 [Gordonia phage Forza]UXE04244.1 hypothetical protein SEA_BLUENGOLD_102 [Gordonia phage BlueNGold]WBF03884.1 hypothetical protein SEA_MAREELIH_101 [Gordonia phage Mareelih]